MFSLFFMNTQFIQKTLFGEGMVWQWWVPTIFVLTLGTIKLICLVLSFIKFVARRLRWFKNFASMYAIEGKNSYAVVTGGSDGIGL